VEQKKSRSKRGKQYLRHLKIQPIAPKNKVRIKSMAASATTGFSIPATVPAASATLAHANRRRRISPQAGYALDILGHAIEYLTDEFVHESHAFASQNAQLEAVQLLMSLNRQIYFECPEVPTLAERWRALLHLHTA
jgi:hypothetical protein